MESRVERGRRLGVGGGGEEKTLFLPCVRGHVHVRYSELVCFLALRLLCERGALGVRTPLARRVCALAFRRGSELLMEPSRDALHACMPIPKQMNADFFRCSKEEKAYVSFKSVGDADYSQ